MRRFACSIVACCLWTAATSNFAQAVTYSSTAGQGSTGQGIAQSKSDRQASEGRMRHVGGSMGQGRYEGVGFSTVSADDAIRHCCYWGQRTPVEIGVARGSKGWYATVLYR